MNHNSIGKEMIQVNKFHDTLKIQIHKIQEKDQFMQLHFQKNFTLKIITELFRLFLSFPRLLLAASALFIFVESNNVEGIF